MVRQLIDGAAVDRWCGGGDCAAVVRRKGWHFQGLLAAGGINKVRFKRGGILKVCRTFYWCSTVFTCTYAIVHGVADIWRLPPLKKIGYRDPLRHINPPDVCY
jgi:hypothetical protein